jgi:hypothetical protein
MIMHSCSLQRSSVMGCPCPRWALGRQGPPVACYEFAATSPCPCIDRSGWTFIIVGRILNGQQRLVVVLLESQGRVGKRDASQGPRCPALARLRSTYQPQVPVGFEFASKPGEF